MMAQDWAGPLEEPVVCKRDRRPSEGGRVRSAGSSEDISPSECWFARLCLTGIDCVTTAWDCLGRDNLLVPLIGSPRNTCMMYDCIPEESHWGLRAPPFSKARLKLDLSPSAMSEPPVGPAASLHSPPPLSRLQSLQAGRPNDGSSPTPASSYRDRGHTVSGISPVTHQATTPTVSYIDMYRCGMNPR
ncbi:unnamed protein product [Ixodes pacificus]